MAIEIEQKELTASKLINEWHQRHEVYQSDTLAQANHKDIDQRRQQARQEMIHLLHLFLEGKLPLNELNTIFQQKSHNAWSVFYLRGMSGGMFLNKLVKHLPDKDHLAQLLRVVLRLPQDLKDGRWWMQTFVRFLEDMIDAQQATRSQLQPARVPFFLSLWWHIQEPEDWPLSFLQVRNALLSRDEGRKQEHDPVEEYFLFRERFLTVSKGLDLTSWEMELLLTWHSQQLLPDQQKLCITSGLAQKQSIPCASLWTPTEGAPPQLPSSSLSSPPQLKRRGLSASKKRENACHTYLQWLLAKLGQKVGCDVWIRADEHRKCWQGEPLEQLSLPALPFQLPENDNQLIAGQIDLLWLLENEVVAAYEIKHMKTDLTDIILSLLRLYDLGAVLSRRKIYLCLVVPQARFHEVRTTLSRPLFQLQEMQQQCALISEELLVEQAKHILRWASSLSVIQDLTSQGCAGGTL